MFIKMLFFPQKHGDFLGMMVGGWEEVKGEKKKLYWHVDGKNWIIENIKEMKASSGRHQRMHWIESIEM